MFPERSVQLRRCCRGSVERGRGHGEGSSTGPVPCAFPSLPSPSPAVGHTLPQSRRACIAPLENSWAAQGSDVPGRDSGEDGHRGTTRVRTTARHRGGGCPLASGLSEASHMHPHACKGPHDLQSPPSMQRGARPTVARGPRLRAALACSMIALTGFSGHAGGWRRPQKAGGDGQSGVVGDSHRQRALNGDAT